MTTTEEIAFLGPLYTYSHAAAKQYQDTLAVPTTLRPAKSIEECFQLLDSGEVKLAVVPFENSTNGSVVWTLDFLRQRLLGDDYFYSATAELLVPVSHCFFSNVSDKKDITKIYSHPQVWGQCVEFLKQYPNVERIDVASTAKAAELAANEPNAGAISSEMAGAAAGIKLVETNIADKKNNTTRFLGLSSLDDVQNPPPTKDDLSLISFTTTHNNPGALCAVLEEFRKHDIDLSSINSRPSLQDSWHYIFFVECRAHVSEERMKNTLKAMESICSSLTVIGSFPRCPGRDA
ncbi:Prephenate dehydratase-domain-containing protein [Yarrowia lipolytica]|jgi:prephenate dehydratase|uniref:prephenate dehydratase n=2 Tax=Yarrowia lipolytica TaxID=4952 RepID=Q6CEA0_YARLI|nr:YALI0B17336p [Yarrowia lipolytica CLIB122]AOW01835.1 hypothetical protein YALI1_B22549g [Yarrowia lipolytica]KAB8280783.1 Prephenate dehydratase-domain-containing protein [Yarrowia lipolytica]KAE8170023.1 Prephenate dehydratase-domain-containing protein [Yarrowia lipolytica]KAJ8052626.1 Prephenate dehydratase-domain-containing protein [Yarrowia lipolytica]QNP96831.1 Bifunctional chorismate mutase/prephenate dehydratase [Yarrowia lipolytica]|eukprot:XP_501012.1 YALI0B17336p [Yarrowia lipolytica CLIB122]